LFIFSDRILHFHPGPTSDLNPCSYSLLHTWKYRCETLHLLSQFQFYKVRRVLEMDGGGGCTKIRMHLITLNHVLKMIKMVKFMYFATIKN
jgi:hypothetical protein